ncbi:MAG: DUF1822 family protein [Spirulina sp.]
MSASPEFPDLAPDVEFDRLHPATVHLSPAEVDWAVQIGQSEPEAHQWLTFLRAMALRGVDHWLRQGSTGLTLTYDPTQPPGTGIQAEVNGFRLCLVVQGSLSDDQVTIPQTTHHPTTHHPTTPPPHHPITPPSFAHIYLLVEVREEADQVTILGGLRRDRLLSHQASGHLTHNGDTYTLPIALFDTEPEEILLYLTCLNPDQLLAAAPETAPAPPTSPTMASVPDSPTRPWINVGPWLQDRLDAVTAHVTETLTWNLLPPLALSHALMAAQSPADTLEAVLRELAPAGVEIPAAARGAYTDLQATGLPLRLYALIWPVWEHPEPEWCLFLVLGPAPGDTLPDGVRLQVSDATGLLADSSLDAQSSAQYLYVQVFGTWEEAFTVAIQLPNGATLHWPPFVFRPEDPVQ